MPHKKYTKEGTLVLGNLLNRALVIYSYLERVDFLSIEIVIGQVKPEESLSLLGTRSNL